MSAISRFVGSYKGEPKTRTAPTLPGELPQYHTERGLRTTPEDQLELLYQRFEPPMAYRSTVLEIRRMDKVDGRVKRIHGKTARDACKSGLVLDISPGAKRILGLWREYKRRLELDRREKLESDVRGLMMEGNLPMQWVLDTDAKVVARGLRMPAETIKPLVNGAGQFENVAAAYQQWDWLAGKPITTFPLWQLMVVRLQPDNYDNLGSYGRPYMDAARAVWRQLELTEKNMVVRRHMRAPMRFSHVLEGAGDTELASYETKHKARMGSVTTDFFQNRKGGVTPIQGDANLEQIADVVYLLDTFFAGAPAPKGLFGYAGDLSRDILEDMKRDYYEEIDSLQDTCSYIYELGFRLDLLLHGINPDEEEMSVSFAERRTETPNQRADLALKHQALGVPQDMVYRTAGLDPAEVRKHQEAADDERNPYPRPGQIAQPAAGGGKNVVKITPGNARKGESATNVGT